MKLSKTLKKAKKLYLSAPNSHSYACYVREGTICPRGAVSLVLDGIDTIPPDQCFFKLTDAPEMEKISSLLHAAAAKVDSCNPIIDHLGSDSKKTKRAFNIAIEAAKEQERDIVRIAQRANANLRAAK